MRLHNISLCSDMENTIVTMLPATGPICVVNRLFRIITKNRLTTAAIKLQKWYRRRRLIGNKPPYGTLLTRWTLIRYFITKLRA